jgi:hypothetical protein
LYDGDERPQEGLLPIIFIVFAVFFCCGALQFFFLRRVRQALVERHPALWRDISRKAWFIDSAVYKFAWRRRDKDLNDPELTVRTKQLLLFYYSAIGIWLIYMMLLVTGLGMQSISVG